VEHSQARPTARTQTERSGASKGTFGAASVKHALKEHEQAFCRDVHHQVVESQIKSNHAACGIGHGKKTGQQSKTSKRASEQSMTRSAEAKRQ